MTGRALRQEPDLGQHAWHALLVLLPQGDAPARMGAKNAIFFECFPMFGPSLSWQNDRFYI